MNKKIVYLKETNSYDDIFIKKYDKMPLFFKKIIFIYKNLFNIITKKKINDDEMWILPIKEKYSLSKIEDIMKKSFKNPYNIYLLSNNLKEKPVCKIMNEKKQKYITEEKIKKVLLLHILEYITKLQRKEIKDLELTILVNNASSLNMYLIEELAKKIKILKIVSLNIYKFKNIEEKLYNDYGIAIQFSNSYKKSLEKSKIIINLDFSELEINEYEIFDKAIVINCVESNIKIKSRLFNGIIVNSSDIKYKKELISKFKKNKIYNNYSRLMLYASIIEKEDNITKINEKLNLDNVCVIGLIGNSGIINKKEFQNILDKNKKTE